jgi:hypothetical protein
MGAVLGIAAMGRTQEKLAGANNGGASTSAPVSSFSSPVASSAMSSPVSAGSFSSPAAPVSSFSTGIAAGKARPAEAEHPAI